MGDFCCARHSWFDVCHCGLVNEIEARCFFVLTAILNASNLSEESWTECALGLERLIEIEMPWLMRLALDWNLGGYMRLAQLMVF